MFELTIIVVVMLCSWFDVVVVACYLLFPFVQQVLVVLLLLILFCIDRFALGKYCIIGRACKMLQKDAGVLQRIILHHLRLSSQPARARRIKKFELTF